MGFIRQAFGRITIESRSESFYISPSYGWRREYSQVPLRDITVGQCFRFTLDGEPKQVVGQLMGVTLVKSALQTQPGDGDQQSAQTMVHPVGASPAYEPDYEEVEADGNFARHWRETPNPEFFNEDIDDLIAALEELRDSR